MKSYFNLLLVFFVSFTLNAQSSYWSPIRNYNLRSERHITPNKYLLFTFDYNSFMADTQAKSKGNTPTLDLPMPDGTFHTYKLVETPVFSPGLADKYPGYSSFTGTSDDFPGEILKFSVSPFGIDAMIMGSDSGSVYIDPITIKNEDQIYQVYYRADLERGDRIFECGLGFDGESSIDLGSISFENGVTQRYGDCQLRMYRLALACTGEYASFHGGTIEKVLAAYNTAMTRVNGVYETEVGVTMQLIPETDQVIFLNANSDPYSNNDGFTMLSQNQTTLDNIIGSENYDIGHVFSTGGGGIANLRSPCNLRNKAKGVTGLGRPVGDAFFIDYVCHEMGHQYGANHTFNNSCNGNRNSTTSFEPGSASTIMGYAGICAPDVQNGSDDYFHGINLQEIGNFVTSSAGSCGVVIDVPNQAPSVSVEATQYNIPVSTPFALTAQASDPDGDVLTYTWEQMDNNTATMPPLSTSLNGPLFRSTKPSTNPTRYFPDLLSKYGKWEVLPDVPRSIKFRCTVRDNNPFKGCTDQVDVTVRTRTEAGPFVVTHPNSSNIVWTVGSQEIVTWDVANTDKSPINSAKVDILLSIDGGVSYPIMLAENVDNNGSYEITVPSVPSDKAKVMVKSADNIFYDISDKIFKIKASFSVTSTEVNDAVCNEDVVSVDIVLKKNEDISTPIFLSVIDPNPELQYTFSDNNISDFPKTVQLTISKWNDVVSGEYSVKVAAQSDSQTLYTDINIYKGISDPNVELQLVFPAHGTPAVNPNFIQFSWNNIEGVRKYNFELSSYPDFSNPEVQIEVEANQLALNLVDSQVYFWRVTPLSDCVDLSPSSTFSFRTSGEITGAAVVLKDEALLVNKSESAEVTEDNLAIVGDNLDFVLFITTQLPVEGELINNGTVVKQGDSFTMNDILNGDITYNHFGGDEIHDEVHFSVFDDLNRWLPDVTLPIRIYDGSLGVIAVKENRLKCFGASDAIIKAIPFGGQEPYSFSLDGVSFVESDIFFGLEAGSHTIFVKDANGDISESESVELSAPTEIVFNIETEFYDIILTASGGTGIIEFSIDDENFSVENVIHDPGNGIYTIIAKDDYGCTVESEVVLDIPELTIEGTLITDVKCAGSTIVLSAEANGGFPPYQYSVDNSTYNTNTQQTTKVGNPVIYVMDAGGKIFMSDTIFTSNPDPIAIDFEFSKYVVTVVAFGGTGPLTYSRDNVNFQEDNVIDFEQNGTYRIYVKDSLDCSQSKSFILNVVREVDVTVKDVSCHDLNDGSIKLSPKGGISPFQYKLNDGEFGTESEWKDLPAGDYTWELKDSRNDLHTGEVTIQNPDDLALNINISGGDLELEVSGGTPPFIYSIDNGGVFFDTHIFTELDPGDYSIIVKDDSGCTVTGQALISSSKDIANNPYVLLPNPTSGVLQLNHPTGLLDINSFKMANTEGKLHQVNIISMDDNTTIFDVSGLNDGLYFLYLITDKKVSTMKFIKN